MCGVCRIVCDVSEVGGERGESVERLSKGIGGIEEDTQIWDLTEP